MKKTRLDVVLLGFSLLVGLALLVVGVQLRSRLAGSVNMPPSPVKPLPFETPSALPFASPVPPQPIEQPVTEIPLLGLLADRSAEISGLAWYRDYLMLLPQYPRRSTGWEQGYIYALPKSDILDYLDGRTIGPLEPIAVPFDAYGMNSWMENFQGFEAIGFQGDRVYLTIESGSEDEMMGYLAAGQVAPDLSKIVVDTEHLVPIPPQASLDNKADEALLVLDDRVITFYEANGVSVNPRPAAHVFSLDLQPMGTIPLDPLEYRITDAARLPGADQFWVINSFVIADLSLLPASDPLTERFGKGPTHARFPVVERLVALRYDPSGITLAEVAPIQLKLESLEFRNWEGLALLDDRGFLLVTDKHPSTLLAFIPLP